MPSRALVNSILDALMAVARLSIPFTIYFFLRRRQELRSQRIMMLFAALITAAGLSHSADIWCQRHAAYTMETLMKGLTTAILVVGAVATVRFAPLLLRVATPEQVGRLREEDRLQILESERANQEKLRSCIEAASQAILGVSHKGLITLVNCRTEEMFGYTREELLGQKLEILLPERFRHGHTAARDGYFARPRVRAMGEGLELAGRRKDGTEFAVEIGLSHVATPDGPMAFGLVSDISGRRRAEAELERINGELRRSNAEILEFAHVASHDLQEPLRMVTNYLQLIERRYKGVLDADGREFIHYAVDGASRMKALITDLLYFSRAGTNPTHFRSVSALDVVQNALANLKTAIDEAGALITIDSLPTVVVDPVLFTQVFQNLIANAIKFQKGAVPYIHISAVRQGSDWIFSVRDNGIGIPDRHRDRIFHIFERLHSSEEFSGSGIGLAITRKIVERHGGRIWVESQPGVGSVFSFSVSAEMELALAAKSGPN
jgi:PAS domain S-box-containing protein